VWRAGTSLLHQTLSTLSNLSPAPAPCQTGISYAAANRRPLDKEIDRNMKKLSQPLRLRLTDRPPPTQYLGGGSLVAEDGPDVLCFSPRSSIRAFNDSLGETWGERMDLLFVVLDQKGQDFSQGVLFRREILALV